MNDDVEPLVIYYVFDRPLDYPDCVVVARQEIRPHCIVHLPGRERFATVVDAVAALERRGLTAIGRDPSDVLSLIGGWI